MHMFRSTRRWTIAHKLVFVAIRTAVTLSDLVCINGMTSTLIKQCNSPYRD